MLHDSLSMLELVHCLIDRAKHDGAPLSKEEAEAIGGITDEAQRVRLAATELAGRAGTQDV